jgi:hypothetical protein
LRELQAKWSRFEPLSELSRLNERSGHFTVVSTETYQLISEAVSGWWRTNGRYDPTVIEAMNLAGYDQSFDQLGDIVQLAEPAEIPVGHLGVPRLCCCQKLRPCCSHPKSGLISAASPRDTQLISSWANF